MLASRYSWIPRSGGTSPLGPPTWYPVCQMVRFESTYQPNERGCAVKSSVMYSLGSICPLLLVSIQIHLETFGRFEGHDPSEAVTKRPHGIAISPEFGSES